MGPIRRFPTLAIPMQTNWRLDELSPHEDFEAGTPELGFSVIRGRCGASRGVTRVRLRAGNRFADLLPQRGMGIWQADQAGIRLGWDSPVQGPVHPSLVPLHDPGGLGWLEGFDELLVRCGLTSNGAPEHDANGQLVYPLHGRIANLPAGDVQVELDESAGWISVSGVVEESRFHFRRLQLQSRTSLFVDNPQILIEDTVSNLSDRPAEVQMLYHANFGPPLLEPGSRIVAPVRRLEPRDETARIAIGQWDGFGKPDPQFSEQVYFMDLACDDQGDSLAMLTNRDQSLAVCLEYTARTLPCFTLWKNTAGLADGYVTGLEPGTNFPNPRSTEIEAGRFCELAAGAEVSFRLGMSLLVQSGEIRQIAERIAGMVPDTGPAGTNWSQ